MIKESIKKTKASFQIWFELYECSRPIPRASTTLFIKIVHPSVVERRNMIFIAFQILS